MNGQDVLKHIEQLRAAPNNAGFGTLLVSSPDGRSGRVCIDQGAIVSARFAGIRGSEAVDLIGFLGDGVRTRHETKTVLREGGGAAPKAAATAKSTAAKPAAPTRAPAPVVRSAPGTPAAQGGSMASGVPGAVFRQALETASIEFLGPMGPSLAQEYFEEEGCNLHGTVDALSMSNVLDMLAEDVGPKGNDFKLAVNRLLKG